MEKKNQPGRIDVLEKPFSPTPIVTLSGEYTDNDIDVKREDLLPFSFGGNKARKAAGFYRDIIAKKPGMIMTYGSNSSNHCRIIANMACSMDIPCHIISSSSEVAGKAGRPLYNRILVKDFGASVETVPVEKVHDTIETRMEEYSRQGLNPYFIQGGGHGNIGTQAYVDAFREILAQEKESGKWYDAIFFASGTGTTQAGLVCGMEMEKHAAETAGDTWLAEKLEEAIIVGISIARPNPRGREVVRQSILDYYAAQQSGLSVPESLFREEDLIFDDHYRMGGYGQYTDEVTDVIRRVMQTEGMPMDTTYVGKAFTGMLQYLKDHGIRGKKILFLHTGGTPLYFDHL